MATGEEAEGWALLGLIIAGFVLGIIRELRRKD